MWEMLRRVRLLHSGGTYSEAGAQNGRKGHRTGKGWLGRDAEQEARSGSSVRNKSAIRMSRRKLA